MKVFYILKSLGTFIITLYYLVYSYFTGPKSFIVLKKRWANRVLATIGYSVQSVGEFQPEGPVIYVGNHVSYLDIMVMIAANPNINFLAKKEIRKWPILGFGAERVGTLFIDRESKNNREALRNQIGSLLVEKKSHLVIFPSGTTTLHEEKPWKKGIFEIAKEFNIPVQLFYLTYTPFRESAYIGDDDLISTMSIQFGLKNKSASVTWLQKVFIDNPEVDAEKLRLDVRINYILKNKSNISPSENLCP